MCRRSGDPHRHGQLCHAQGAADQDVARAAATLPRPLHADVRLMDQSGRALVRRADAQAACSAASTPSVGQLEADIAAFVEAHNADPKPYRWTKSATKSSPPSNASATKSMLPSAVDNPPLTRVRRCASPTVSSRIETSMSPSTPSAWGHKEDANVAEHSVGVGHKEEPQHPSSSQCVGATPRAFGAHRVRLKVRRRPRLRYAPDRSHPRAAPRTHQGQGVRAGRTDRRTRRSSRAPTP